MIANVSPASLSYFETLSTLKFAQRAKMIKNDAVINEDSSANVRQLKLEIQKLKLRISELEIEKASLKCEASGNNQNIFVSPVSRHQSHRKTENVMRSKFPSDSGMHLYPENYAFMQNKDEQFLSPSKFSCFGLDDFTSNSVFVKRIKELEDLIKLFTESSLKAAKYYEAEMTEKERSIKLLERQLEEYKIIQNKDEMLINFRDKTIQMLKSSINLNQNDLTDQQLKNQFEEIEALKYKLKSNPEYEILKERCARIERENEQINGEDGKALETLFRGIVKLNESIQEYFTKYHSNTEQDIVTNEKMKRMSGISDIYEKEKKDFEDSINKAQQEISSLKIKIEELWKENSSCKDQNIFLTEKEQSAQSRYEQIKHQLDEYRREMSNYANANQNEHNRIKLELINFQNTCEEYESTISLLNKEITNLKDNINVKTKQFDEEKSSFIFTKQSLEKEISRLSSECKQVNDELEYNLYEYNELEEQKQQIEQSLENISEENANLQSKLNEVESENLCLTTRVSQLEDENDVLQQTHVWQTSELEELQKKINELNKESIEQKNKIQSFKKTNKLLKDSSIKRHQDIQLKYSETNQQLNELQIEYDKLQENYSLLNGTLLDKEKVIERQAENIRNLVEQNTSLKEKVSILESDIKNMNEALNANNEEFREYIIKFEDTVSQVRQLSNELTLLQNEKRSNENKYESNIRKMQDDKEQTESKLVRTQKKIFEQENQLTSISRQLEVAKQNTENNISLKKEVETKKNQLLRSENKYQLTQNEVKTLSEVIAQKDREIKILMSDKDALKQAITEKESDIYELSNKIDSQRMEIDKIANQKYELENNINELSGHSNSLQKIKYVSSLREKYNILVNRNTELDKENKKMLKIITENGLNSKLEFGFERSLSSKEHSLILTQLEEPKALIEKQHTQFKFTQEVKENQNPFKGKQKTKTINK